MKYQDFTVRMRDFQEQQFKVEVLQSPVDQMRQAETVAFLASDVAHPLSRLEIKRLRLPELIALGEQLADLLLPGQVCMMLLRSLDLLGADEGLRLRLVINEPALANLPWEYVYLDRSVGEKSIDGFLVLDPRISMSRHEALARKPGTVAAARPLKLVVGLAAPTGEAPLDLQRERSYIESALAEVDGIDTTFVNHLTVEKFEAVIGGAHIFHFAGHGTFASGTAGVDATRHLRPIPTDAPSKPAVVGAGQLVFEDGAGRGRLFAADKLAQNLATVRVVVLGACETSRRDGVNVWSGIAPALMRVGIPAAVAMQYEVYDESTIAFARRFYGTLSTGLSLDEAVTQGRLAILNLQAPFELDFGVPVLYMRAPDGIIFPEVAEDVALADERKQAQLFIEQIVEELHRGGKLTGVTVERMAGGQVKVKHEIKRVSGEALGANVGELEGGKLEIQQQIAEVKEGGSVTGVQLGDLE